MERTAGQKAGITVEAVVDAAEALMDEGGMDAVSMAAVADRLGVRSPSLYAHVGGLDDLRRRVALRGARRMGAALAPAGDPPLSGVEALRVIMHDYRSFALAHPGLYEAAQRAVRAGEDPELEAALAGAAAPALEAVAQAGVPPDERVHLVRAVRAALHGFVDLERNHGFGLPVPVDDSFDRLVELMLQGFPAASES